MGKPTVSRAGRGRGAGWGLHEPAPLSALQDLEPQQLLLFVQSFGIPVSSMSKLLRYLDQAVAHDPQTLEQNIMDKSESRGPHACCRPRLSGSGPARAMGGLGREAPGAGTPRRGRAALFSASPMSMCAQALRREEPQGCALCDQVLAKRSPSSACDTVC